MTQEYGKLPPQAVDLEEAVLGALLLDKNSLEDGIGLIQPKDLYKESHQIILSAIRKLYEAGQPVDILTVVQELKKTNDLETVGGAYYISTLTNKVASGANVEFHCRILIQKSMQRQLIMYGSDLIKNAYDESKDVFDTMEKMYKALGEIDQTASAGTIETMRSLYKDLTDRWEEQENAPDGITGIATGFKDLDLLTHGFEPGMMVTLAGRPGMGKTTVGLQIAKNAAQRYGKKVAFITLEMTAIQIYSKLLSAEARVDYNRIAKSVPTIDEREAIEKFAKVELEKLGFYIIDRSTLTDRELRTELRNAVRKYGVQFAVVDYLQLMDTAEKGGNREQAVSNISRTIKSTAKQMGIPILALAQLSRAVEMRGGDKRPMLSDLRESGSIEQDSDMVMFCYRPEYYDILTDPDGNSLPDGYMELIIAKHRGGALDDVELIGDMRYSTVQGLAEAQEFQPKEKDPLDRWDLRSEGDDKHDNLTGLDSPF